MYKGWKLLNDIPTSDIHINPSIYNVCLQKIFPNHALVHVLDGNY